MRDFLSTDPCVVASAKAAGSSEADATESRLGAAVKRTGLAELAYKGNPTLYASKPGTV
jgi:hypothetical protein